MPKTVMDYSKCIIYKIVCNDLSVTDCYVGHTTNFKQRKNCHRINCNYEGGKDYNCKIYQTMRANGGRNNWNMVEIEKFPCKDVNEARARERYWIETLKPTLNMNIPNRSQKEYNEEHKEERLAKQKEYYEENKEEILAKQKENYEANKEQINAKQKEYYEANKEERLAKQKEWYEANKEQIAVKQKEHYETNKEKINEKFTCECGIICSKRNILRHYKSKKHKDYLASQK